MVLLSALFEILQKSNLLGLLGELFLFIAPLWIAVISGVLVGWAWKPKWVNLVGSDMCDVSVSKQDSSSSSSLSSTCFASIPSLNCFKFKFPSSVSWNSDDGVQKEAQSNPSSTVSHFSSCHSEFESENSTLVAKDDLENLCRLVEEKDGGPAWIEMMDRSTPTMGYKAWRRDPPTGPPQYRSRTIFENATPELVRNFFWDDEFRLKWDDMLMHASIMEECPSTGTMVMHWVRKFPFFCSDREYIIGRRIWESGRSYYCVTKGVPCSSVPRRDKPRRVDLYYSSWCIRAVESKSGDGQLTSCEVLLFHHEDMGIPWEIAKFGVRQGMWGAVRKIEPGLRAYQKDRASRAPISRCAFMAGINTKVSADYLSSLENANEESSEVGKLDSTEKPVGRNIPKLVVIGGVIALACSLDRGLLTKAVIFGVAQRFAKIGRRL